MGISWRTERIQPSELRQIQNIQRSDSDGSDEFGKHRSSTDICCLILFTIFLIILVCLLGYCIFHGDIFRVINGYDNCGHVCGTNKFVFTKNSEEKHCNGNEKNDGKFHIILKRNSSREIDRLCVDDCGAYKGYRPFFNRCIQNKSSTVVNTIFSKTGIKNFFTEVSEDLHLCWRDMCYLFLLSLGLSILLLILFRYLVGLVVWIVLFGVIIVCSAGSILLWIMWKNSKETFTNSSPELVPDVDSRKISAYFVFAIIATIVTLVICLIIFVMRNRIRLVVQLFEESGKAIAAMPLLLLEPILTFSCLAAVIFLWVYFSVWIESSGILSQKRPGVYYYEKDDWMKLTRWYNFFAMLWMAQFMIGCQHMIIAGAVSVWYFKRDKSRLGSPILRSAENLIRFHLGSVALGSFLIALIQFIRVILKAIEKYLNKREGKCVEYTLKCCQCCLYCFEKILKYLSRNAYIEIAMHGYSFCEAGKQAFKLLSSNVLRVAAINSVGDFVLFLGKVLVVIATVIVGIQILQFKDGLQHMWVPIALSGLFAYFVAHCFMTVYEMAIDTIFICFCEDCEMNDGISQPYFMSRGLMEFVENSKKALKIQELRDRSANERSENVNTISGGIDNIISVQ
ncbi:choline transporter-like protein 1 [Leptinotarsa decemlineata]|uniref:choline transporter-like protein 1 n=1 Tax=Leptinotarsa decemlineata TaxID=7539 RepID=UPI003D308ABF